MGNNTVEVQWIVELGALTIYKGLLVVGVLLNLSQCKV